MDPVKTQYSKLLNNGPTTSSHQHGSGPTITAALDVSKWMPGADWMATVSIIIWPMVRRNIFLILSYTLGSGVWVTTPLQNPEHLRGKPGFHPSRHEQLHGSDDHDVTHPVARKMSPQRTRSIWLPVTCFGVGLDLVQKRGGQVKRKRTLETCQASWCLSHHSAKDIKQTHTTSYRVGLRKLGPTKTEFGSPITRWFVDSLQNKFNC